MSKYVILDSTLTAQDRKMLAQLQYTEMLTPGAI